MKITSEAFKNNKMIPKKYTCDDESINPSLEISGVPKEAKSLALIVEDPDAEMGTWAHWIMWNIPADTNMISENNAPDNAVQGSNSDGNQFYEGPCPPAVSEAHRYLFKLYALDTELDISSDSKKENLEKAMEGHTLETAELIGMYKSEDEEDIVDMPEE